MDILEVYNNYTSLGICSRTITKGEEYRMVSEFIDYKKEIFRPKYNKKLAVFLETKINGAYPDIVFTEYDPTHYEKWNKKRNKLSVDDLKLLHYIYIKTASTSSLIIKELSMQYKTLLSSLEALMDAELLERKDGKWLIPNRQEIFGIKKIESVEAKISKWNEVMQQAIINTSFASESFVLTKRRKETQNQIVEKMKKFGIGIYFYENNKFSRYTKATHNKFPNNYNSIYLNECIGRILNN